MAQAVTTQQLSEGNLYSASQQWANRPDDERFGSIEELGRFVRGIRQTAREVMAPAREIEIGTINDGRDIGAVIPALGAEPVTFSHYGFGQLAARIGAPAGYLRTLPADLAQDCLRHGIEEAARERTEWCALAHINGKRVLRALTSERYARVWDVEIVEHLYRLAQQGWRVPPARPARPGQAGTRVATAEDVIRSAHHSLGIREGDAIAPAGLYASDKDVFAFLIDDERPITSPEGSPLWRGFFVENSEVGDASLKLTTFLYSSVCGNHIVWGAKDVRQTAIRHVGSPREIRQRFEANASPYALRNYAQGSARELEATFNRLATVEIAPATVGDVRTRQTTKDAVVAAITAKVRELPESVAREAYDVAEEHRDTEGAPTTPWGLANGVTRLSQKSRFADRRVNLDRIAGRVLAAYS